MATKTSKIFSITGCLLTAAGLLLNVWVLELFSTGGLVNTSKVMIWIFDIFSLTIGVALIKLRNKISFKEVIFVMIPFIIFLLLLEGGIRLYFLLNQSASSKIQTKSEILGWETIPNQEFHLKLSGFDSSHVSFKELGFRKFGDVNSSKKKILVIGDSYTQAMMVSDGECYYDYIPKQDFELFVYGSGGYGTLQEYMIIDKFYDEITPDLILWQLCSNDLINNDLYLESNSFMNNNHMNRPYLLNGQISMHYPAPDFGWFYNLLQKSYLLRLLNVNMYIAMVETKGSIENELSPEDPRLNNTKMITSEIFKLAKKRIGNTPVISFSVDRPHWASGIFEQIAGENDLIYIDSIPEKLQEAKNQGVQTDGTPHDAHWNKNGHKIAGKIIAESLRAAITTWEN